jgi:tetratricopeptide (TPR) repeat protein
VSSTRDRRPSAAILLVVALALIGLSQSWLEAHPLPREPGHRLLYLPNGRFLQVASLGYPTFVADLLYLWSIQHYGSVRTGDRFQYLEHIYSEVIARLDPDFVEPYLVGALILVAEKGDVEAGLRLLDQGMEANPEEWILPYEAGFWAYDTARDYDRAAAYFKRAMEIPGAPPSTRRLYAEMHNKKGDKETSLALWRQVLEGATDPRVLAIAANHVHDLALEVDLMRLTAAVDAYRQQHGANPASLAALVAAGLLSTVPADPDGDNYRYDRGTGTVSAASSFKLRRR